MWCVACCTTWLCLLCFALFGGRSTIGQSASYISKHAYSDSYALGALRKYTDGTGFAFGGKQRPQAITLVLRDAAQVRDIPVITPKNAAKVLSVINKRLAIMQNPGCVSWLVLALVHGLWPLSDATDAVGQGPGA